MTIVAIDPGTTESAFVKWNGVALSGFGIEGNGTLLEMLENDTSLSAVDVFALEMIASYGMPTGREIFETVLWIGRFDQAIRHTYGRIPKLIYRQQIKLYHCQSARAKDANIRQALIDKYGPPGTKKNPGATYGLKSHLWAAFALATYVSEVPNGN